jgi:hypothetical protein
MLTGAKTGIRKIEPDFRTDFMNERTISLLSEPACRLHYVKKRILFR